jgi:hypothetical protein
MLVIPSPTPALVVPVSVIKGSIPAKSNKATYREAVQRKQRKDAPPWRDDTFQVGAAMKSTVCFKKEPACRGHRVAWCR